MNAGRRPRWAIHLSVAATLLLCLPAGGTGTEVPLRSAVAQQKKLTAGDPGGSDHFGASLAIDGTTLLVSGQHNDDAGGDSGSAYIFERDSGGAENWGQVKKLTAADAEAWAVFGVSVAISGSTAVVGAPYKNAIAADSGAAYVFERDFGGPGNWGQVKRLTPADAAGGDLFGISVAISGSTVVVGSYRDDDAGFNAGAAYVFERDSGGPGNWGQVKKLTAADSASNDFFGWAVAVAGSTAVVGAAGDDDAGGDSGSAYVFGRDFGGPGNWGQVKKLTAGDATAGDYFGNSVAIDGSIVAIGAHYNDAAGTDTGSVYVFARDFGGAGNWGQVKQLTAADAGADDNLGARVACTDSMVVTSASGNDAGGADSGAAYVFARNVGGADNWGQMQKLTAADAAAGDEFGWAVTLSGPTVAVGAPYDDVGVADVGSTYVFRHTVDVEVSATESIDPVIAGSGTPNLTYTVTALNNGPEDAAGVALSVDLTLPPGVSVASITPSGTTAFATTTAPDGLWTVDTLVAGASETLTVALTAGSSTAAGSDVVGVTAMVSSAYGVDTDPGNDSATLATSVALRADLAIIKTDGAVSAVPGESLVYTLVASNLGPSDAAPVTVTDAFPAALTCSFTSVAAGGATGNTSGSGNLSETLSMPASSSVTWSVTCLIDPGATGMLSNTATISSAVTDPVLGNNSATDADTLVATTDLAITPSDAPDPVVAGSNLTYTLTVANQGPSAATGVVATDTLPPGVSFVSASPGCAAAAGVVTCTVGNLSAGSSTALTIAAVVDPGITGTITNTAGVTGNQTDPNLPNTVTETTVVVAATDLVVTKSDHFDPVTAGGSVSWMLEVTNFGPSNATGVVVTDTLPPGVRFIATSSSCALTGRVVRCAAGDLAAGAGVLYEIAATVDPAVTDAITNTAAVTGNQTDPNLPNTVAETTTIVAETDLAITKSAAPDPVAAGSPLTWTLQVTNRGPSLATGVVATDALPAGVSLVSASPECAVAEDLVTCAAGDLAVGAGAEFTLEVTVNPAAGGAITNTAEVSGHETDPAAGNNRAVATTAIVMAADLVLSQSDSADPVRPGDELTWTVTVTNQGPDEATEVVVTDALPQGVALVATSGCAEDPAGTPDCTLGTIPAGESRSYELTVTVEPGVAGMLLHSAGAASAVAEAQPGDEESTETTEVEGEADLAVELSGPATAVPGGEVRYTLTVTNLGPAEVVGARVLDYFAPELIGVCWSRGQKQGTGVLDDAVDLAAGDAVTYDITATVAAEATDTVDHSAFVESGGVADPDPVNDAATTAAELRPAADLRLALGNGRPELIPGKAVTYTATVSNPGPSDAPPVRLTGIFPLTDATVICTDCEKSIDLDETFPVPAGGSVTWVVAGTVPDDAEGTLVSEAALELPPDFDDPDPSNNQAVDVDDVIPGEVVTLGPPLRLTEGRNPAVVFSDSGRSLVVFEQGEAGGTSMIRGLEIDASGVPGNDFPLSTDIGLNPAVALDPELNPEALGTAKQGRGAFLTVWQEELEPSAVLGQLSRDGRPLGPALGLSTRPTSQVRPDVVRRPVGGFLVVWESTGADAEEEGIFGRFVDPAGQPVDDVELRLNREEERTPQRPALASDGSRFLVVWDRPASDGERRIAGQRLTPAGDLAGPTLELSDAAGSQADPAVAFDEDSGRYMVVWRQEGGDGGGIAGRVFDAAGRPQGEPFLIGGEGDRNPEVSSEEGNFTVVWERSLGPRSVTFGQLIDPEGSPVGSEFRVSGSAGKAFEDTGGARPAVAYAPHGAIAEAGNADVFAVVWGDRTEEEEELSGQRYAVTADLLLTVFDDPDPLPPGTSALVYTVVVQNLSTADAEDVVVTHQLPAGVTLVVSQGCAEDPTAVEFCTLGTVEGGVLRQYVLETRVDPGIQGTLPLPATVHSSTPDPDQNDNVADELTRFGIADLKVDLGAENVTAGERALWRLTVANAGPSPAGGAVVALELPLGVAVVASDGCGEDPSAVETCTLGTLAAGAERRVELEVEFARTLAGTVTPSASVASGVYDPDLASNIDHVAIEVFGSALEVGIDAPARVAPGSRFSYAVWVRNAGGAELGDVEIRAALPAGLGRVATQGCAEDPAGLPVCTLGTITRGEVREMELTVAVDEGVRGIVRFGVNVAAPAAPGLAVASAETAVGEAEILELLDGRFEVRVEFHNQHAGDAAGVGQAVPYSDNTGFFYFFDPNNIELLVKVLDGGAINGRLWFFYGALTDLEYDITVTDRATGAERRYHNPAGEICGEGDTEAFPWSKGKKQGSPFGNCIPGAETLCLVGDRFRVEVTWRNQHAGGVEGPGRAVPGTDDTGYFWFFDADNLELAVKVLDARAIDGRFWVFYGGLSDVEYWITITDTVSGEARSYHHPPGEICGGMDLSTF